MSDHLPPQELQGHTPQTQLPQHSGEPARAEADHSSADDGFGQGPDEDAEPENASSSEGASFPAPPRMRAFMKDPDTFLHQRPRLTTISEMRR